MGIGGRPDDFVVDGLGPKGLGKRFDRDLEAYRALWTGQPVGGGDNPGVPAGTREVPLLIGGMSPASYARMAKWGKGYIAGGAPAEYAAGFFEQARAAWKDAGREGQPYLAGIGYFALGNPDKARGNLRDYYAVNGDYAEQVAAGMSDSAERIRATVDAFAALGTDEFVFVPGTDDIDDVERLAEIVL
jgi:alkanesulfonate monooxygenase SsuD/methylene tetrahydromethanopterin reductase-like flavin-dependent oxidoreductase (luciferase family)